MHNLLGCFLRIKIIICERDGSRKGSLNLMIEIIREESLDRTKEKAGLPKNIRQIGSPDIGDRIYIENQAYQRMHPHGNFTEKTVYVMLGKFEEFGGRQCTFVENVIEMEEIQFDGALPVWNDDTWAYLYRMLGHEYDTMVIAGWAIDIRGQLPNMTAPLERLHRTYFGGTHQILFLMDSLEQEEAFYSLKNGALKRREGYYIYYEKSAASDAETLDPLSEKETDTEGLSAAEKETESNLERTVFARARRAEKEKKWENPLRKNVKHEQEEKPLLPAYTSTLLLVAVIAALGYSAFRNYSKMNEMEETLSQMDTAQTMFQSESSEDDSVKVEDINSNITSESNPPAEAANADTPNTEGTQTQGEGESQQQETAENDPVQTEQPPSGEENQASQTMSEAQIYLDQGYYIVEQGDSLAGICRKIYQTTDMLDKICEINGIDNPDAIYAGQYLALPN